MHRRFGRAERRTSVNPRPSGHPVKRHRAGRGDEGRHGQRARAICDDLAHIRARRSVSAPAHRAAERCRSRIGRGRSPFPRQSTPPSCRAGTDPAVAARAGWGTDGSRGSVGGGGCHEMTRAWTRGGRSRLFAPTRHTPVPKEFLAAAHALTVDVAAREEQRVAVMCSESLWWRCHRRLIADVMVLLREMPVQHLGHDGKLTDHIPSAGARVCADGLHYDVLDASG